MRQAGSARAACTVALGGAEPGTTQSYTQAATRAADRITGIRSQVGIKIFGNNLDTLEETARQIATVVKDVPGAADVYPERIGGADTGR